MTAEVTFGPLPDKLQPHEAPTELSRLRGLVVTDLGPQNPRFGELTGVVVAEAKARSAAEFAGFLPDDIITHVSNRMIRTPDELFELAGTGPEPPEIRLMRGETPLRFKLPF